MLVFRMSQIFHNSSEQKQAHFLKIQGFIVTPGHAGSFAQRGFHSSCGKWGCCCVTSLITQSLSLGPAGSVVLARGLSSWGVWDLPGLRIKLCVPLYWQVDS